MADKQRLLMPCVILLSGDYSSQRRGEGADKRDGNKGAMPVNEAGNKAGETTAEGYAATVEVEKLP